MVSRVSCGGWWSVGGGPGGGVVVMMARRGVRVGGVLHNLLGRLDNGRVPRGARGGGCGSHGAGGLKLQGGTRAGVSAGKWTKMCYDIYLTVK